jgi:hypothetical protein
MTPLNTTPAKGKSDHYRPNQAGPIIGTENGFPEKPEYDIHTEQEHHCERCPLGYPIAPTTEKREQPLKIFHDSPVVPYQYWGRQVDITTAIKYPNPVIPAKAGIQAKHWMPDPSSRSRIRHPGLDPGPA